jgi:hypothetical protein
MKAKLLGLIAGIALISVSQASAVTLVGTTSDAKGINGLVVDGVTYDVTFVNEPYQTVFASTPPTFLGNYTGAVAAASALTAALNSLGVTTMDGVTFPTSEYAEIPFSCCALGQDQAVGPMNFSEISGGWVTFSAGGPNDIGANFPWVDQVEFSATPLPSSLPLFVTGLGICGLLGWRTKRKAPSAIAA